MCKKTELMHAYIDRDPAQVDGTNNFISLKKTI